MGESFLQFDGLVEEGGIGVGIYLVEGQPRMNVKPCLTSSAQGKVMSQCIATVIEGGCYT